ncbi:MAG TPA: hypothetical protein VHO03_16820 [Ignavibacteriales bacterium]|nr:hypothetical protein [Ignavibacteriales bacterium]
MKIKLPWMPEIELKDMQPNITYNNCTFGTPYLIQTQQAQKPIAAELPEDEVTQQVVDYVHKKTGFNREMIERVLDCANDYLNGGE